jgi:hypothetical protein
LFGITLRSPVLERPEASFFQIDEPLQVVAGSFEVQREGGAHNSHAAHQFSAHVAHGAEDMFDAGPPRGYSTVALFLRVRDRLVGTAFALDLDAPASRCQRRFTLGTRVTAVGVDVAAGVFGSSSSSNTTLSETAALVMMTLRTSL